MNRNKYVNGITFYEKTNSVWKIVHKNQLNDRTQLLIQIVYQ